MVLVTGGTGLVGSHLLLHLLEKGIRVRAIHRPGSDLRAVEKIFAYYRENADELFRSLHWMEADINDIPAMEKAFEGVGQVYHAAALISFDPKDRDRMMKVNAEGTANIVNLCLANDIKKLCFVSSIATMGDGHSDKPADEEDIYQDQDANDYGRSKFAAELEVWRGSVEGLPVVIINPGIILGPGFWKGGSGILFRVANKGNRLYPEGSSGFVAVNDVVRAMVKLMESNVVNERFLLVSENMTYREILTLITKNLGLTAPSKPLRHWQLESLRVFDWLAHVFTGKARKLTKEGIRSLNRKAYFSNAKIVGEIDFAFEPVEPIIEFCCSRFKEENP
jgi:nucleoside-diphosphate-sugar epimerase